MSTAVAKTANTGENQWTMRMYREGDIPALVALINASHEADNTGQSISEQDLTVNFAQPFSDPPHQVVIVEGPRIQGVPENMPIGYGRVVHFYDRDADERIHQLGVKVHPLARDTDLQSVLIARMLDIVRRHEQAPDTEQAGKVSVLASAREVDHDARNAYEAAGLKPVRWGWIMERSLSDPIPEPQEIEGVHIRNYNLPDDNSAAREAYNNSFIDHYEFHALPDEIFNFMMATPEMRHDLSWLAEIDEEPGKFAGFCINEIKEEENAAMGKKEGWIGLLGTIRGWRGKGLGRSLLLRSLHSLKAAGMDTALLGVDSESPTGANRLYESVGFTVRRQEMLFRAPLSDLA